MNIPCFFSVSDQQSLSRIGVQIQGFDDQKLIKIYSWKKNLDFFDKKIAIYMCFYVEKDVQATRERLQPWKKEHTALKNMKFLTF